MDDEKVSTKIPTNINHRGLIGLTYLFLSLSLSIIPWTKFKCIDVKWKGIL